MKIIKRVRYQRVRLGDLSPSTPVRADVGMGFPVTCSARLAARLGAGANQPVRVLDKLNYPPEVTWDVVGMTQRPNILTTSGPDGIEKHDVYYSDYETIYE